MTTHKTGTREEWLAARMELLKAEGAHAAQRRAGAAAAGAALGSDRQGAIVVGAGLFLIARAAKLG